MTMLEISFHVQIHKRHMKSGKQKREWPRKRISRNFPDAGKLRRCIEREQGLLEPRRLEEGAGASEKRTPLQAGNHHPPVQVSGGMNEWQQTIVPAWPRPSPPGESARPWRSLPSFPPPLVRAASASARPADPSRPPRPYHHFGVVLCFASYVLLVGHWQLLAYASCVGDIQVFIPPSQQFVIPLNNCVTSLNVFKHKSISIVISALPPVLWLFMWSSETFSTWICFAVKTS